MSKSPCLSKCCVHCSDILRFADLLIGNKVRVSEEFGISEFELRLLPTVSNKILKNPHNTDLFDYFLSVERLKMKFGQSMFSRLEISETNKF